MNKSTCVVFRHLGLLYQAIINRKAYQEVQVYRLPTRLAFSTLQRIHKINSSTNLAEIYKGMIDI